MKSVVIREGSRVNALVFFYYTANGLTNPDVFFSLKPSLSHRFNPQNFSLLGFAVSKELGNKQTNSLTDILLLS